ncbi:MAG: 30S ribosomal protein S3, partial [Deltaproteobacteria bacterium RBG_13_58_19]
MGQKVHPIGFRLGNFRKWDSVWFAKKEFSALVLEDWKIRNFLKSDPDLKGSGIAAIDIKRAANKLTVKIHTSRPGMVIGQKGKKIEELRRRLEKLVGRDLIIDVHEVRKPEINAQLVAENIALQLERRVSFRRAMKKGVGQALKFGAKGIKIRVKGRLAGAEIARQEWYREGRVPLHTLRAFIDYGFAEAKTTYGIIGVKT